MDELLSTLRRVRDEHASTHLVVKRTRDEYLRKVEEAKRQLQRRIDELEGVQPDHVLLYGTAGEAKAELENKRGLVRAQQMSLLDAAVAAYVGLPYGARIPYVRASRWLEEELNEHLHSQVGDQGSDFHTLKRREVWQACHYFYYVREIHMRLEERETRLESFVKYWNERAIGVFWDATILRGEMRRNRLELTGANLQR